MDSKKSSADVFAENLRAARRGLGMTQETLAERAGVTPQVISRYELGKLLPSFGMLDRLADALGTDTFRLFIDRDRPFRVVSEGGLDGTGRRILSLLCPDLHEAGYRIDRGE